MRVMMMNLLYMGRKSINNSCMCILIWTIGTMGAFATNRYNFYLEGVDKVIVKRGPWDALPPVSVSCMDFEGQLHFDQFVIRDGERIKDLCKLMESLKPKECKYGVDVRCKIYMYHGDELVTTACMNKYSCMIDGNCYKTTDEMVEFLNAIPDDELCPPGTYTRKLDGSIVERSFPNGRDSLTVLIDERLVPRLTKLGLETPIRFEVMCTAEQDGTPTMVKASATDMDGNRRAVSDEVTQTVVAFFKEDIRWKPNKERMCFDIIPVNITFIP